ncbi:putative beta-carotene-binding protein [Anopheles cruzii]|uniref:putative beta-carotene-binding protein n=1 Tax=Anopheles cruzii TaxID=68878 RepID=UPI0022EC9337|nr:putative beta-carotene-binding protein [Anopheles cruzii]
MKVILVLFGVALCAGATIAAKLAPADDPEVELPAFMEICYRDSPDLGKCIKSSIQRMLPEMHTGIESLGFPSLDPHESKSTYIDYKRNQMSASLHVKNAKTFGMSKAQIVDVRATATDKALNLGVDVRFPELVMEGYFKGEGRFNSIKLASKGYFNNTMTDVTTTWQLSGEVTERNGEQYMEINSFDMSPEVGNMKIYATGLFPDPELNDIALEFVNQYWPMIYKEMLPNSRQVWEPVMVEIVNKIFLRVPYRRLLPKRQ